MKDFSVVIFRGEDAAKIAELAHQVAFNEMRLAEYNTFNYVLACANLQDIYAYATIIEMDKETAYMQHGGAMPNVRGNIGAKRTYNAMIDFLKLKYKRISTRISNQNVPMLKLAMSEGLRIQGCDLYQGQVFLHVCWGF